MPAKTNHGSKKRSFKLIKHRVHRSGLAIAALALTLGAGAGLWYANSSHDKAGAAAIDFCAQHGTGYCLNDWNNGGFLNQVKMYQSGTSNEGFRIGTTTVCGQGKVTSTCPFNNRVIDAQLLNDPIVKIYYLGNGLCLGSIIGGSSNGAGNLQGCGDPNGNGAGTGTIFVEHATLEYINKYWTNYANTYAYLCSGGASKGPVWLNFVGAYNGSCSWEYENL
jgi:hypothetical protein